MYQRNGYVVGVRPIVTSDYERLRQIELAPGIRSNWRHGGYVGSFEDYVASLWRRSLLHATIYRKSDNEVLGLATCYNANLRSGTAWIAVIAAEEVQRSGLAFAGMGLFVSEVFAQWPMRKLYLEAFDSTFDQYRSLSRHGISHEATLVQDHRTATSVEDRIIIAITREVWEKEGEHVVNAATRPVTTVARPGPEPTSGEVLAPIEVPTIDEFVAAVGDRIDLPPGTDGSEYLVRDLELDSLDVLLAIITAVDMAPGFELPEQLDVDDITLAEIHARLERWLQYGPAEV